MTDYEPFRQDMIHWLESQNRTAGFGCETGTGRGMKSITLEEGIAIATGWAKDEVAADVRRGRVPQSCRSFSELHDYVDANRYGGGFDWPCLASDRDDAYQTAFSDFWNAVQDRVDNWIKLGGIRRRGQGNGRA